MPLFNPRAPAELLQDVEMPLEPAFLNPVSVFDMELMENPERLRAYNAEAAPECRILEDPRQGLTMEDMKYIPGLAERLLSALDE